MTYSDTCRLHSRWHCIDCGYVWMDINPNTGLATVIEGTGAEVGPH